MNSDDLKQICEELEKEYNENCARIDILNSKIDILSDNLENKFISISAFSIIPWIISISIMTNIMTKTINLNIVPLNIVQPLVFGVPVLVGIVSERLLAKKLKLKEKLRKISNAKTEKEKTEESTKYELEKEKLKNANKILKKNIEFFIDSFKNNYNITEKDNDNQTKEKIADDVLNMSNILEKNYQELDIATTKNFLQSRYSKIMNKFSIFTNEITYSCLVALMSLCIYNMPLIITRELENISFQTNIFGVLAPALVGGVASISYCIKSRHNTIAALNNINNELGDNRIIDFNNNEESKQITKKLEDSLKNTSLMRLKYEKEKQKLTSAKETSHLEKNSEFSKSNQKSYTDKEIIVDDIISRMENEKGNDSLEGKALVKTKN